jgi:hypothetical protein
MSFSDILSMGQSLIAIAAILTTYLVFKLQAETFKAQIEIKNLENKKFVLSLRPQFIIDVRPFDNTKVGAELEVLLQVIKNDTISVTVNRTLENGRQSKTSYDYLSADGRMFIYHGQWPDANGVLVNIKLEFQDEIGTKYYQLVSGDVRCPMISPPLKS